MPRPRRERPKIKREEDLAAVAKLRREGALQGEIAYLLGVSRATVQRDEASLIDKHRARAAKDTQLLIRESLARLEWGQQQATLLHLRCMAAMFGRADERARQIVALLGGKWQDFDAETQAALAVAIGDQNEIRGVGLALYLRFEAQRIELLGLAGEFSPEVTATNGAKPSDVKTAEDAERLYMGAVGKDKPFRLVKGARRG